MTYIRHLNISRVLLLLCVAFCFTLLHFSLPRTVLATKARDAFANAVDAFADATRQGRRPIRPRVKKKPRLSAHQKALLREQGIKPPPHPKAGKQTPQPKLTSGKQKQRYRARTYLYGEESATTRTVVPDQPPYSKDPLPAPKPSPAPNILKREGKPGSAKNPLVMPHVYEVLKIQNAQQFLDNKFFRGLPEASHSEMIDTVSKGTKKTSKDTQKASKGTQKASKGAVEETSQTVRLVSQNKALQKELDTLHTWLTKGKDGTTWKLEDAKRYVMAGDGTYHNNKAFQALYDKMIAEQINRTPVLLGTSEAANLLLSHKFTNQIFIYGRYGKEIWIAPRLEIIEGPDHVFRQWRQTHVIFDNNGKGVHDTGQFIFNPFTGVFYINGRGNHHATPQRALKITEDVVRRVMNRKKARIPHPTLKASSGKKQKFQPIQIKELTPDDEAWQQIQRAGAKYSNRGRHTDVVLSDTGARNKSDRPIRAQRAYADRKSPIPKSSSSASFGP